MCGKALPLLPPGEMKTGAASPPEKLWSLEPAARRRYGYFYRKDRGGYVCTESLLVAEGYKTASAAGEEPHQMLFA